MMSTKQKRGEKKEVKHPRKESHKKQSRKKKSIQQKATNNNQQTTNKREETKHVPELNTTSSPSSPLRSIARIGSTRDFMPVLRR